MFAKHRPLTALALMAALTSPAMARPNLDHLDYPAEEIGLRNHGTLTTMLEGGALIALSDDIADLAQLYDIDRDGEEELVFHTRRIPRNPFYITYERVIVDPPEGQERRYLMGLLTEEMSIINDTFIRLQNGDVREVNIYNNPTDPGLSASYVDETSIDDLLQFATQRLGLIETDRYPVLQIIRNVELDSLYVIRRDAGQLVLGFVSVDGVDRQVEIEDLGFEQIETHDRDWVIRLDDLPTAPPQ